MPSKVDDFWQHLKASNAPKKVVNSTASISGNIANSVGRLPCESEGRGCKGGQQAQRGSAARLAPGTSKVKDLLHFSQFPRLLISAAHGCSTYISPSQHSAPLQNKNLGPMPQALVTSFSLCYLLS